MSTVKIVRDAAPGIDRAIRRIEESGYGEAIRRMTLVVLQTGVIMRFEEPDLMELAGGVFVEELGYDGWGGSAVYDTGNATTGKQVGYRFDHPTFLSRNGTEVRDRPKLFKVEGPMPDGSVPLNAEVIERIVREVTEVARDLLRKQAFRETGVMPRLPGPLVDGNPLKTHWAEELKAEGFDVADAPEPSPLPRRVPEHMIPAVPLQTFNTNGVPDAQ